MRVGRLADRVVLVTGDRALDVEVASGGRFGPGIASVLSVWDAFAAWASGVDVTIAVGAVVFDARDLGAPSPDPRQVIAIGMNYADHAAEAGLAVPEQPVVFTKFPSAVTGPDADVILPGDTVDWEAELVVVIGRGGRDIPSGEALDCIAGFTVGQDLSERTVQFLGTPAQFSLGKSFAGFAPTGPVIVTLDEFEDPDRLAVATTLTDRHGVALRVQDGSTEQLVFGVGDLVSRLSRVIELFPGDLVFTGTPPGVGMAMSPARYLRDGDSLTTEIAGIGTIVQRFYTH